MLYPQRNKYRQFIDLSGFWDFRFDINNDGLKENWKNGFNNSRPIAVPASWNDQKRHECASHGFMEHARSIPKQYIAIYSKKRRKPCPSHPLLSSVLG